MAYPGDDSGRYGNLLYGDGGTGKSLLSLQLAVATVLGSDWLGKPTRQGDCLFLTAEDDMDEVHRRLADISKAEGIDLKDLDGLFLSSLAGEDAILAAPDGAMVKPTELYRALEERINTLEPALVVLDTLADLFGGEENQRAHARQFIGLMRGLAIHFGTTIVLLAHPSLAGMASGSGSSGSTGWSNSVRSRLYFERVKGDDGAEDDPDARVLKTMKANYGRTGEEIRLRWERGIFTSEFRTASSFSLIAAQARAERVFLDLLASYQAEGRPVSGSPSPNYAPSIFAKDPRSGNISKAGLVQAMNRLFEQRRIRLVEEGPSSRRRIRLKPQEAETALPGGAPAGSPSR
jgi:RecA-family ATPase